MAQGQPVRRPPDAPGGGGGRDTEDAAGAETEAVAEAQSLLNGEREESGGRRAEGGGLAGAGPDVTYMGGEGRARGRGRGERVARAGLPQSPAAAALESVGFRDAGLFPPQIWSS